MRVIAILRQLATARLLLEMICVDFPAGANLENENPEILLQSALRFFEFSRAKRAGRFCTA
jgi:hypothetical protein